jgi:hypothetical protein
MPRFHIPLIEPDVRYSRIRLSEKASRFRPRKATRPPCEPNQTKLIMKARYRLTVHACRSTVGFAA